MPSALSNHVSSTPDIPTPATSSSSSATRKGNTDDSTSGRMDGVVRTAGDVVAGNTGDRPARKAEGGGGTDPGTAVTGPDQPVAKTGDPSTKQPNKHSVNYVVRSGLAGGVAGCAAKTTVAPLDRVKILFQTGNPQFARYSSSWTGFGRALRDIHARDGAAGLFRGHSATLLKIYPYAAIKFVAYEQYRALLIGHGHGPETRRRETWPRRFASGALAGVTSVFFTYPLDVVRVRLAFETKHARTSLPDICRKIYHEHPLPAPAPAPAPAAAAAAAAAATARRSGLTNFYRGFSTTLLGMVPYAGVSFLTHDTAGDLLRHPAVREYTTTTTTTTAAGSIAGTGTSGADSSHSNSNKNSGDGHQHQHQHQHHLHLKPAPLRAWAELAAGGVSGLVSQTVSYPLEVIRRRMQVGGAVGDGRRLRIAETAGMVYRERGLPGFFVGLTIGYLKIVPMAAVSFYTYERMKLMFGI